MTLHRLAVPTRDVAAEALGLLLDAPAPPTLAELRLGTGERTLALGVLGASHVVTATAPGRLLTEQVSCDALAAGGARLQGRHEGPGYALDSRTDVLSAAQLDDLADRLRRRAGEQAAFLCGAFPGSDSALTALTGQALDTGGWAWQTWHLYPGSSEGTVVTTSTRWQP